MTDTTSPGSIIDPARLASLASYGVLDTAAEKSFDDIVLLARVLCATPVALVSLVDAHRQWFKARSGFEPCETSLDRSVCKYALAEPSLLVIPDLTHDPRTRDNPLVTDSPHLRFYAGAPLRMAEGTTIGTLCVLDTEPRAIGLSPEQEEGLWALAGQVTIQLGLRREVSMLRSERLSAARSD